jgi:hypothetical protein
VLKCMAKHIGMVMAVLLIVAAKDPSVWGQMKPELDAKIPLYQPLAQVKGRLHISGSESMNPLLSAWID